MSSLTEHELHALRSKAELMHMLTKTEIALKAVLAAANAGNVTCRLAQKEMDQLDEDFARLNTPTNQNPPTTKL